MVVDEDYCQAQTKLKPSLYLAELALIPINPTTLPYGKVPNFKLVAQTKALTNWSLTVPSERKLSLNKNLYIFKKFIKITEIFQEWKFFNSELKIFKNENFSILNGNFSRIENFQF